jgi:hypothetical protein
MNMSGYFITGPLWTWVKNYDCCDLSSVGTLTHVNSLQSICWACFRHRLHVRHRYLVTFLLWRGTYRADMLHDIIHSYYIKKQILKTKRNLKSIPNRSHILRILPTLPLHSFFVRYQNSELPPSLESLWNPLWPWYSKFSLVSLLLSPNSEVDKSLPSV